MTFPGGLGTISFCWSHVCISCFQNGCIPFLHRFHCLAGIILGLIRFWLFDAWGFTFKFLTSETLSRIWRQYCSVLWSSFSSPQSYLSALISGPSLWGGSYSRISDLIIFSILQFPVQFEDFCSLRFYEIGLIIELSRLGSLPQFLIFNFEP